MLLVTRDDEDVLALEGFDELRISGLAVDESASLVLSIDPTLPPAVAAALGKVTEGNPALVELLRCCRRSSGPGTRARSSAPGRSRPPASVRPPRRDAAHGSALVVAAAATPTRTIDRALMTLSLDLPRSSPRSARASSRSSTMPCTFGTRSCARPCTPAPIPSRGVTRIGRLQLR